LANVEQKNGEGAMEYQERLKKTADLMIQASRAFALTGAGISTESGIPDYRSPGKGLWEKVNPLKTASASALRHNPKKFYQDTISHWRTFADAQPNRGHRALKEMEDGGLLLGIVTQNIDGLHYAAGSKSVLEVHGHMRTGHCLECGDRVDFSKVTEQLDNGINPPRCHCSGILRPDVVLFEDPMSHDFFRATKVLSGCDLLLVAGTSLQVYPVASLPQLARQLIIVNNTPTSYDESAAVIFRESIGGVLSDLQSMLCQ